MRIRTIRNCMKEGSRSILKNGLMSIASIITISACLFILGITYCVIINAQQMTHSIDSSLGMVAFLKSDVTEEDALALVSELNAREGVKEAKYISPEQAWADFKETLKKDSDMDGDVLDELDEDNPLADSANIEVYMIDSADQKTLAKELDDDERIRSVRYSQKAADAMTSLAKLITYAGLALMLVLMLIAILLINNTIKLSVFIRRNEINIMKYIGAKDSFIRLPFIVEGMLIGLLGVILPTAILYFGYQYLIQMVNDRFPSLSYLLTFVSGNQIMQGLLPIFLIMGVLVGMIGSTLSIRKHLKV